MPPKGPKAAAAVEKKKEKEEVAAPAPAAPTSITIAPNSGKTTAAFSYKAMLTKSVPPPAAAVEAPRAAPPAPAPELTELPVVVKSAKKAGKGSKKSETTLAAEAAVAESVPAASEEAAPATESVVEPVAPAVEEVVAEEAVPTPPQLVVETATPTTYAVPASPEKIVADEAPAVIEAPVEIAAVPTPVEKEDKPQRMNWADGEYSTFTSNHLLFGTAVSQQQDAAPPAVATPLVTFRNGHHSTRRYNFQAPSNDRVVTSLMAVIRSREDDIARREEALLQREEDLTRREASMRADHEKNISRYTDQSSTIEQLRNQIALLQNQLQQAQQVQVQQQQQQPPQQQAVSGLGHHHHHHQRDYQQQQSMAPHHNTHMSHHHHSAPMSQPYGRNHGAPMQHHTQDWADDDYNPYPSGAHYGQQPMPFNQVPRNFGRPQPPNPRVPRNMPMQYGSAPNMGYGGRVPRYEYGHQQQTQQPWN